MEEKRKECIEIIALTTGLGYADAVRAFEYFNQLAGAIGKVIDHGCSKLSQVVNLLNAKNGVEELKRLQRRDKYLRRVRFKRK